MTYSSRLRSVVAACLLASAGSGYAVEPEAAPSYDIDARTERACRRMRDMGLCRATARAMHDLAEFRNSGAEQSFAIAKVSERLNTRNRTGSNIKGNYTRLVGSFAQMVWDRPELGEDALLQFGFYSCGLSDQYKDMSAPIQDRIVAFETELGACDAAEKANPGRHSMSDCACLAATAAP